MPPRSTAGGPRTPPAGRSSSRSSPPSASRVLPAAANFVCAAVGDGRAVAAALLRDGVVVRPLDQFGDAASIRVTVGTPEENAIFAESLARVMEPR